MVKDYIGINHNYSKTDRDFFPVIRPEDEYPDAGNEITLGLQYIEKKATVIFRPTLELKDIPTSLLCFETGAKDRERAVKVLEEAFRKDLDPESELTILFLKVET